MPRRSSRKIIAAKTWCKAGGIARRPCIPLGGSQACRSGTTTPPSDWRNIQFCRLLTWGQGAATNPTAWQNRLATKFIASVIAACYSAVSPLTSQSRKRTEIDFISVRNRQTCTRSRCIAAVRWIHLLAKALRSPSYANTFLVLCQTVNRCNRHLSHAHKCSIFVDLHFQLDVCIIDSQTCFPSVTVAHRLTDGVLRSVAKPRVLSAASTICWHDATRAYTRTFQVRAECLMQSDCRPRNWVHLLIAAFVVGDGRHSV